jgi:hypothetical protein
MLHYQLTIQKSNKRLPFNLPKPLETSIPIARCLCGAFTNVQNGILYEDKLQADVSYTIKCQSIVFTIKSNHSPQTIQQVKSRQRSRNEKDNKIVKRRWRKKMTKTKPEKLGKKLRAATPLD